MKATFLKLLSTSFLLLFVLVMVFSPVSVQAQDEDSVAVQDNSSSFNDSVQFDDMEPIFYEAVEEEVEPASEGNSDIMLYGGIAVVLIVVLIVLKKVGKKKS